MRTFVLLVCVAAAYPARAADLAVRVRFGLKDAAPTNWDSTVSVKAGRVTAIDGWRFGQEDSVTGVTGWKASTRGPLVRGPRTNNPQKAAAAAAGGGRAAPRVIEDNGVVLTLADVTPASVVEVKTPHGAFQFKAAALVLGEAQDDLNGAVEIERVAVSTALTTGRTDDDHPAAVTGPDGTVWVAYVSFTPGLDRDERARSLDKEPADFSFLATPAGGDQLWLQARKGGKWAPPIAMTAGKGDIYKCALAVDAKKRVWAFWSERKDGQFDVWARPVGGEAQRLTTDGGNDVAPVAGSDGKGRIWVAWQGARERMFRILERHQGDDGTWTPETVVSANRRNAWAPAIAARGNQVAIAWDTYDKGDYDVWVREWASGKVQAARPVANSLRYEARPCLTYDRDNRLWVAWEESGPTWGKDWGAMVPAGKVKGVPLYGGGRQIGMRVLAQGRWFDPADSFLNAVPGARPRKGYHPQRVPALEPEGESRKSGEEAEMKKSVAYNNLSRLATDSAGHIWLLLRARANDFRSPLGSVWMEHALFYDGKRWTGPILVPHSDDLLYNVPAVVAAPEGGILIAQATDHRMDRSLQAAGAKKKGNHSMEGKSDPYDNDIYIAQLAASGKTGPMALVPSTQLPDANPQVLAVVQKEDQDVARVRAYRMDLNGTALRPVRGEFHRHTEVSGDGGNDGPIEDMWRYAIDVAAFDWIGNGDHDSGAGREYPWWLIQKTTDAFHLPGSFDPMFTYERSVPYPEGHRNVVFSKRGIRTLPRLPISNPDVPTHAPDTQMLYRYLRKFGGVCSSHTSATNMGTDWRDNDPVVEPFVEIYQGCRQNYEMPGAPRSPTEADAIGGWRPKGFVNLALQKGYRLAFQSSSDHGSTHISYAIAYVSDLSREAILDAMKARRTYAATDNIIADVRSGSHMMGEEFTTGEPPKLKIHLHGTGPFAKVLVIKDNETVQTWQPGQAAFDADWTDPHPAAGKTSYYYVRGEQADGELVWASPMWITYKPR